MKKLLTLLLSFSIVFTLAGCKPAQDDDIYIVFTNDVHCSIDGDIGYAGVAAYKQELQAQHKYVALVDSGDFSSGSTFGVLTSGEGPTSLMNEIGYDVATLGNHEFDYKADGLFNNIIGKADFEIVCSNIHYSGNKENRLSAVSPYTIKEFGNTKVGFIGVSAPSTVVEATPAAFKEDDVTVYDFLFGDTKDNFYTHLQSVIDEVHSKADYVILLTHCGIEENCAPFRSIDIAQKTYNVDVILDGHSHSEVLGEKFINAKGGEVQIWQTGTQLNNIGQLVLIKDHKVEGLLISEYDKKEENINNKIIKIYDDIDEELKGVIGNTDFDLTTGITRNGTFYRTVRIRETNLGDLVADCFRYCYNSDIAIVNGGGVRADIVQGDITLKNALDVQPFVNSTCVAKLDGQTILDMLEYSVYLTESYTDDGELAVGEFGGFLQVSGIKFTADCSIKSPVVMNGDNFDHIGDDPRRVSDVYVLSNGEWVALDPNAYYTIASVQYLLVELGNGYSMLGNGEIISKEGATDTNCFFEYIAKGLDGKIPEEYREPQGRITIK